MVLALTISGAASNTDSELTLTREYQLKAAYLFNFAKFTTWPTEVKSDANTLLNFCVMGNTPLFLALERFIAENKLPGRKPKIKRVASIDELVGCQILFISRAKQDAMKEMVEALGNFSVLTVGETANFALQGGMIEFITIENKLRFAINVNAAKRARLELSSKLLKLAQIIGNLQD